MNHHHVVVCAAVLCSTALCFAQAQVPKTVEVKSAQSSQSAVVKSTTDTAKAAIHTVAATETSKTVKKTDTVKTVHTAVMPPTNTAKAPQTADTNKSVKKTDTVKTVQTTVVLPADTAKSLQSSDTKKTVKKTDTVKTVAPSNTAKPASTAPSTPAVK